MIDNLDLTIAPGAKVGLVGRSGAGKSTMVNLLLRFFDLEGGRITIDGQDISGVTQESLRRQIGFVTQDTSLLTARSAITSSMAARRRAKRGDRGGASARMPTSSSHGQRYRPGGPATTPMSANGA